MKAKKGKRVGLLWFNDNPGMGIPDKIVQAIEHFEVKYGKTASICFVHPSQSMAISKVGNVIVQASVYTLKHHFFVCE